MTMLVRVIAAVFAWGILTGAAQADSDGLIRIFEGHASDVSAVAFSPDGRQVISGGYDNTLRLWDVASGRMLHVFDGHSNLVRTVAFSPDGRQVVSGSDDKSLRLWDVASGQKLRTFKGHSDAVRTVAFSPDGRQLISGSRDITLRLWDVTSGRMLRIFKGHRDDIRASAFSPDGRRVISGSRDNTLRLWDVASGRMLRTFEGHSNWVRAVAFSPDGRRVISGSRDNTLRLWDVEPIQPSASGTPAKDVREAKHARADRQTGPAIRVPLPSTEEVMRMVPGGAAADRTRPSIQVPLPLPEEVRRVTDGSGGVTQTLPAPDEAGARAEARRRRDREEAIRREVEAKLRSELEARMRAEQEARSEVPNTAQRPQPAGERRLALVIGIDAYESVPRLHKAVNDARAMSTALKDLGFDVILGENLDRRGINRKLLELESRITAGDVVFFFFAGHGFEIRNQNYLLPADVPQAFEGQENLVTAEAFAADQVLDRISSRGARTLVAVLDACRNNPFEQPGIGRALTGSRGLARIDPPNGVFVVFSAGAKQEAIDRLGDTDPDPNSVFTRVFLRHLKTPGLSIDQIVKRTRVSVRELARSIGREQTPAFYDQAIEDLVLVPGP